MVVWEDNRNSSKDVYGTFVHKGSGKVSPISGFPISNGPHIEAAPAASFDGNNFLVVWHDSRTTATGHDIYGALLDQKGKFVPGPGAIKICDAGNKQAQPVVAFGKSNYLVVWEDLRSSSSFDLYGARVNTAGKVLDTSGIKLSKGASNPKEPALAFGGGTFLVVWKEYSGSLGQTDIHGTLVSSSGSPSALLAISSPKLSNGVTLSGNKSAATVAHGAKDFLVVWQNELGSQLDVHGRLINTGGKPVNTKSTHLVISNNASDQQQPSVAFDGLNYLVVWQDSRNTVSAKDDIYGKRVTAAGKLVALDGGGVAVQNFTSNQHYPVVVWGGASYLVAWEDSRNKDLDVYGVRVVP